MIRSLLIEIFRYLEKRLKNRISYEQNDKFSGEKSQVFLCIRFIHFHHFFRIKTKRLKSATQKNAHNRYKYTSKNISYEKKPQLIIRRYYFSYS